MKGISGDGVRISEKLASAPIAAPDPYRPRWRELRLRQMRLLCVCALGLAAIAAGLSSLPSIITKIALASVALVAVVPFVCALGSYPCPRCKKLFFDRSHDRPRDDAVTFLTKKCVHCGIDIGAPKAAGEPVSEPTVRIIFYRKATRGSSSRWSSEGSNRDRA